MSFYSIKQIKSARKNCRCYWCGCLINICEPKTVTDSVWEDDCQSDSFHPECHEALERWHALPENKHKSELPEAWLMQRGSFNAKGEQL